MSKLFWIGSGLMTLFLVLAFISLWATPYDITKLNIAHKLLPPNSSYWLGTDHLGRDMLSMVMLGAQTSIMVALVAVGIGMGLGVPLGLWASAHHGTLGDDLIMRGNDLIFAFPSLVIAILITAVFGASAFNAILAIGIFNIPVFARLTRAAALPLWHYDFILYAQLSQKGRLRIAFEHILPNITSLLIVQGTVQFSIGILAEAALSYIGLGAQPPTASWGRMLSDAQTLISLAPHTALVPGVCIVLMVLGLNLFGDGLRDWLNPKTQNPSPDKGANE